MPHPVLRLAGLPLAALFLALAACDSGGPTPGPDPGAPPTPVPVAQACAAPPFGGTIFVSAEVLTRADPTAFVGATAAGRGSRQMFDRRVDRFVTVDAYLVTLAFGDGPDVEMQVNPEFGSAQAALAQAARFGPVIGRLPRGLRTDLRTVWVHQGDQPFGGGNNNLLIHTEQADRYEADGILEETLVHEASHTSLDDDVAAAAGWRAMQTADKCFISTYARDNPAREDVAESFLLYLALRHRPASLSAADRAAIQAAMPNRIAYFDWLAVPLSPFPS